MMDDKTVKVKEVEKVEPKETDSKDQSNQQKQKDTSQDEKPGLMGFLSKHWASIAVILYILSPIDLIPDFIPIAGGVDDVSLLVYQLYQEYKAYKVRNPS